MRTIRYQKNVTSAHVQLTYHVLYKEKMSILHCTNSDNRALGSTRQFFEAVDTKRYQDLYNQAHPIPVAY